MKFSSESLVRALPAPAYLNEDQFARERERIFFREWFCVGRAEQIAEPGDFLHVDLLGERLLVVRDKSGAIQTFFNVCSHRGAQLVSEAPDLARCIKGSGRFGRAIVCPYHAWTYELSGELRGAPYIEFTGDRPRSGFSLKQIPTSEWGGFLFVNVAGADTPPTAPLAQQIATPAARMQRYPLADLRIGHRIVYEIAANWKLLAENYNECYHCGPVHPELCRIVPAFRHAGGAGLDWEQGIPHREGAWTFTSSGTSTRAPFPGLSETEKTHHKGEILYPNLWLSLAAEHVAAFTLWPMGPRATRVVCDFLFHRDEIGKADFDPHDVVEFWDVVNKQDWAVCESVQRGVASRGFRGGLFAPMEDSSMDIRKYVLERTAPERS